MHDRNTHRTAVLLLLLAVALAAMCGARLCIGQSWGWPGGGLLPALGRITFGGWGGGGEAVTLMDLRLLRLVLAVLVGVALATSGVALQVLLRNPLAEPFILGLSSGAAVGVMAQMLIAFQLQRPLGASHTGALCGAAVTMLVVYAASRRRGVIDPLGLLLIGVVMGTINGGLVMLLNYVTGAAGLRDDLARWMMGYLNEAVVGSHSVLLVAGLSAAGLALLLWYGPVLDAATFPDIEAHGMGVNLRRARLMLFLVASALAAGAVVLAGPIAFVGLISPHLGRMVLGPRHRPLVLGSAMIGAMLILSADGASVVIDRVYGIGLLPIGVFTALLGGPMFVWMLRPRLGGAGV